MRMLSLKSPKGFTLIELLVVMVLIGIITGLATLSIKSISKVDDLTAWILSFRKNLEYSKDMAALRRKNYGIQFEAKSLKFMQNDDAKWVTNQDPILNVMQYPKDSFINLYLKSGKLLVDDNKKINVIINTSADITPFELHLVRENRRHTLAVEPSGEIFVTNQK